MMRVCVDMGGTFTDCLVLNEDDGSLDAFKASTTPQDPTAGLLAALEKAARFHKCSLERFLGQVELLVHGTTLATNALLTGRGVTTGLITTEHFRDVVEIRRGLRDQSVSIFNVFVPPYEPLVPRYRRFGVPERVRYTGEVITPLDEDAVRKASRALQGQGVESVAVCFLYSHVNPQHEARAKEICEELFESGRVTVSHEVLPVWREYERFSTTLVSAYLEPVVADYLAEVETRLRSAGFAGTLLMLLSNGLVQSATQCIGRAVTLINSGPAAAPTAAVAVAAEACGGNLLSVDMGGTSVDVCLIRESVVPTTTDSWVGNHRVAIKMVDVQSVGAGGGSIAWVDAFGLLRVGPQSAGANPGPACYGMGTEATVTDADLVLGYISPDYFLGGEMPLSVRAARSALDKIAARLQLTIEETAQGIFNTVNSNTADLITEVATKRGHDVRDFTLVAAGGAGPVHAAALAQALGIRQVFVPSLAALFSAFGMFAMDLGRDFVRTHVAIGDRFDVRAIAGLFEEMEVQARRSFADMGLTEVPISFARSTEMRYVGQFHEIEIPLTDGELAAALSAALDDFHRRHEQLYSFSMPWLEPQFLNFRIRATTPRSQFTLRNSRSGTPDASHAIKGERNCIWDRGAIATTVYGGEKLSAGNVINGPAIIEEDTTTVVVPPNFVCRTDSLRNLTLRKEG